MASTDQSGVYEGVVPPSIAYGRCFLDVGYLSFDTSDDADEYPEERSPKLAKLFLKPNVSGAVVGPNLKIYSIDQTVLYSNDGHFEFWAIDGNHSSLSVQGWNWTAQLTADGKSLATFTFSPDSSSEFPRNIGQDFPIGKAVDTGAVVTTGPPPAVEWDGDQLLVTGSNGSYLGPHLTGPGNSNADVSTYVSNVGPTQTALDARYSKPEDADSSISELISSADTQTQSALNTQVDAHLGGDSTTVVTDVTALKGQVVNLAAHIAPNTGADITAAVQAFVNTLSDGDELLIGKGTWRVDGTLTFAQNNLTVRLRQGAVIDRSHATTATASGLILTGDNVTVKGSGTILSPALWDGTNVQWSAAVLYFTGASPRVKDITLTNVPKIGIGLQNTTGTARVTDVTITGNYPSAQWTEVETVHFGIGFDPGVISSKIIVRGCSIDSCVQGWCGGNYGAGSSSGSIIANNTFTNCWNHGVYNSGGLTDMIVAGNTFRDCSRPVVMIDSGHIVTGNTLSASASGSTLYWTCGIQMRNPVNCQVNGNNLSGDVFATGAAIDFTHVSGGTTCTGNQCNNNNIAMTTANVGSAIRMGTTASLLMSGNQIKGNNISGVPKANAGLITVQASAAATDTLRNIISHNIAILTGYNAGGSVSGIYCYSINAPKVVFNDVQLAYDAAAAQVVGGVWLAGTINTALVAYNHFITTAAYGANVTFRCIWEGASTIVGSRIVQNPMLLDTTKASVIPFVLAGGAPVLDETGAGAPAFTCGPGSRWMRTDGGAGSTFYVKTSASNSSVWTAIA